MGSWKPTSKENKLLATYHGRVGGRLYTEVAAPWGGGRKNFSKGWKNRYIDGVRLKDSLPEREVITFANHGSEVRDALDGASVELIEVKRSLGRNVIGQVLAGIDLLRAEYTPANIEGVVIVQASKSDSALEWFCENHEIRVELEEVDESVWNYGGEGTIDRDHNTS